MGRLVRSPARCPSLLVDSVPREIDPERMRLKRWVVFPLMTDVDRHGIVQVRPGRTRWISRFQMVGKVRIRRRRNRERGDMDCMTGFLLLGGRDHTFPSFDDRLFHRHRSMNAVEFMVQACRIQLSHDQKCKEKHQEKIPYRMRCRWSVHSRLGATTV